MYWTVSDHDISIPNSRVYFGHYDWIVWGSFPGQECRQHCHDCGVCCDVGVYGHQCLLEKSRSLWKQGCRTNLSPQEVSPITFCDTSHQSKCGCSPFCLLPMYPGTSLLCHENQRQETDIISLKSHQAIIPLSHTLNDHHSFGRCVLGYIEIWKIVLRKFSCRYRKCGRDRCIYVMFFGWSWHRNVW